MSWTIELQSHGRKWSASPCCFATKAEATAYAKNAKERGLRANTRVVKSNDQASFRYVDGKLMDPLPA